MTYKYGLKLWSTNKDSIDDAADLYRAGIYDFLELYIVPGSYNEHAASWKILKCPIVIHASHYPDGINLSVRSDKKKNMLLMKEVIDFADALGSQTIIVHGGTKGTIKEASAQIKELKDGRIIIENKPYKSLYEGLLSNGHSPEEVKYAMDNASVGFCLDMGHAIASANSHKIEPLKYIKEFIKLKPKMYHLTDGDYSGELDSHPHFGKGDFPVRELLHLIPAGSMITVETEKDLKDHLKDFASDIEYLKRLT